MHDLSTSSASLNFFVRMRIEYVIVMTLLSIFTLKEFHKAIYNLRFCLFLSVIITLPGMADRTLNTTSLSKYQYKEMKVYFLIKEN